MQWVGLLFFLCRFAVLLPVILCGSLDLGRLTVAFVRGEIAAIERHQFGMAFDNEQVLGVLGLGLVGEVEAAGDNRSAVDHHDFVVGDGMRSIDNDWDTRV